MPARDGMGINHLGLPLLGAVASLELDLIRRRFVVVDDPIGVAAIP